MTYKDGDELERVSALAVLLDAALALQNKANLNDAGQPHAHERVAKHLVCHGTDHESLRVRRHAPTRNRNDEAGDEVALRGAIPSSAKPDAHQSSAPPDNAHGRMLPVVPDPCGAPAVLGKRIDAAPGGNDDAVEELLAPAGPLEPNLANQQQNQEQDAVSDECTAHDEVRRALAQMISLAEAQRRDASKEHLDPRDNRERLAVEAVQEAEDRSDAAVDAPFEMELEVDAEDDLGDHEEEDNGAELGVYIRRDELPPLVLMTQYVSEEGDDRREDL